MNISKKVKKISQIFIKGTLHSNYSHKKKGIMKRNFIFVLILFITLSLVKAIPHQLHKRTTSFDKCPDENSDVVTLSVTVSPDPIVPNENVDINVSGTLTHNIETYTEILISFYDKNDVPIGYSYPSTICEGGDCPIPAGTKFSKTVEIQAPEDLPKSPNSYQAWVLLGNSGFIPDPGLFGCAAHNPSK